MKVGDKVQGTVTGIKPYGAFLQLEDGSTGLVHISEIKSGYTDNIHKVLTIGQSITVQVIDYDDYSQKASLSLRTLETEKHPHHNRHRFSNNRYQYGFKPLEKALPKWIEQAMTDLKQS
ncbi:S1 RNA-binding domain-containing protein [Streptococcus caprae]|uniref:S1 RNA-binding domain-containing protein n=1 Tax=Streptococcus caprae TaxID=1640501 RepID=A0ABV8CW36_9STRE